MDRGGFLVTTLLGYTTATVLIIGTALTATSIAITANVLKELGRLETPIAKAIICATVIDDVLSLLVLGMTTDAIQGSFSMPALATSFVSAVLFIGLGLVIGVKLVSPMLTRLDCNPLARQFPEFVFIAGVSCAEVSLGRIKDPREGAENLRIIFAAIFLVSLEIIVDLRALTPTVAVLVGAITVVAIVTKLLGCGLPARLFGYSWRDATVIGYGMTPRGEVAMIVALVGPNARTIGQEVFVAILMMSLLATVITPIVFQKWLLKAVPGRGDHTMDCGPGGCPSSRVNSNGRQVLSSAENDRGPRPRRAPRVRRLSEMRP